MYIVPLLYVIYRHFLKRFSLRTLMKHGIETLSHKYMEL